MTTKLNDDILASTGNTAKEQEMFFAGVEAGEANAKNNAEVRGAPAAPVSTVEQQGAPAETRAGQLPTLNQEEYPGLGAWWVHVRIGPDFDKVLARVYGASPNEAMERAKAVAAALRCPAPAAGDALDALRELVECDNIKKRIASMQVCILETDDDVQELDAMMSDLARRQPAAWDAARAALAAQRKGDA